MPAGRCTRPEWEGVVAHGVSSLNWVMYARKEASALRGFVGRSVHGTWRCLSVPNAGIGQERGGRVATGI